MSKSFLTHAKESSVHLSFIRVLLVEDDKVDQQAFRRFVAEQCLPYHLLTAGSVAEAKVALSAGEFDILIVDYSLGDGTALDILAQTQNTPVVVVTGVGSEETAIKALQAGAYDYWIKDLERQYLKIMPIAVNNIIKRFKAEIAFQKFYEELETQVKARTRELEKANKIAETANRVKSEFLNNMSHELTTPLNSIIGFSQILQDELSGELNTNQKKYVGNILQSGMRLKETYTEIIQTACLKSGEMRLNTELFLLSDFLQSSILEFSEQASMQGVTLDLFTPLPQELKIEADHEKLLQVMFNLLDNAVKFTPTGGSVHVNVRQRIIDSEAEFIEISITDTGIGIKEEDVPKAFQLFQQLEAVYTKKYKGTGLGLLLAKELVELHGGRIWLESEFGRGSVFSFIIPVRPIK